MSPLHATGQPLERAMDADTHKISASPKWHCRYVFTSDSGHVRHFLSLSSVGNTSQTFAHPNAIQALESSKQLWAAPGVNNTCQKYTYSGSQPPGRSPKKKTWRKKFLFYHFATGIAAQLELSSIAKFAGRYSC